MLIGLLNAQYTLTGFDASAHMSEETQSAETSAPKGIVWSVIISIIAGFVLLVSMNVGITPDEVFPSADGTTMVAGYQHALDSAATLANAGPPVQIWIDAVGQTGGLIILFLVIGAQFYCGMSSVTANSRMIYAFARDGAIPGSDFWHRINKRTRTPTNSIWLAAGCAFVLGLPYLWSAVAYAAVTSIAVIGLYVAYVSPVFLRVRAGKKFQPGPWTLGQVGPADRHRRDHLGGVHLHPVHAAAGLADHLQHVQLHARRVPHRPRRRGPVVRRLGPQVVQGPQGPGHRGGAGGDREGPRPAGLTADPTSHTGEPGDPLSGLSRFPGGAREAPHLSAGGRP